VAVFHLDIGRVSMIQQYKHNTH